MPSSQPDCPSSVRLDMRRPRWLLCALASALTGAAGAAPVQAQATPVPAALGSTVRVSVQGEELPIEGTLLSASDGTWTISQVGAPHKVVEADDIVATTMQRRRRHPLAGGLIGGGVGLGFALLIRSDDECEEDVICEVFVAPWADPLADLYAYILFPAAGAGAGALIGYLVRTTTWVPAVLPRGGRSRPTTVELTWRIPLGGGPR